MKKREIFILSTLSFSLGIILGFLISPVKEGISNVSGNTTNNYNDKKNSTGNES
jgi:hypothetical protein